MDLVGSLYDQCHEHLRDADKKRDELIGFYAVIVGLFWVAQDKVDDSLKALLTFVVALIGLCVVLGALHYRKWHALLANCLQALAIATRKNPRITPEDLRAAFAKLKCPSSFLKKLDPLNPLKGTEAATFDALLILSFLPWYLLPRAVPGWVLWRVPNDVIGFFLGLLFYVLLMTVLGMVILHLAEWKVTFHFAVWPWKCEEKTLLDNWILRPFDLD